jgi:hypothetical protein
MPAHLLIQDGSPNWWMSPNIWVVPGSDPSGPPGNPIAGEPAYLWALIANTGNVAAPGSRIDFYWADPAMQIVVGVANLVGSAFVDLDPGAQQEVLCLVPWTPSIVNGGHECVLAVAHSEFEASPLPDPLPTGFDFSPPQHDGIAQRNLSVLPAMPRPVPRILTIKAPLRADKIVTITAETGGELGERLLAQLGLEGFRPSPEGVAQIGLAREASCGLHDKPSGAHNLEIHVPKGTSAGVFVSVNAPGLAQDEYELVHLVERSGDRVLGGLSYVMIHPSKGGPG